MSPTVAPRRLPFLTERPAHTPASIPISNLGGRGCNPSPPTPQPLPVLGGAAWCGAPWGGLRGEPRWRARRAAARGAGCSRLRDA